SRTVRQHAQYSPSFRQPTQGRGSAWCAQLMGSRLSLDPDDHAAPTEQRDLCTGRQSSRGRAGALAASNRTRAGGLEGTGACAGLGQQAHPGRHACLSVRKSAHDRRHSRATGWWLKINADFAKHWPRITKKKNPPADANDWASVSNKFDKYFDPRPAEG